MAEVNPDQVLLNLLKEGDESAANQLFERYVDKLITLAQRRINQRLAGRVEAEDIVQSVFRTFFMRARQGQFHASDVDDITKLLARITVRKTIRQITHHLCAKRSVVRETSGSTDTSFVLLNHLSRDPTPEEAASLIDELEHLLSQLKPEDQQILELRMQGYSSTEIAAKLGVSDRKIRRLLERVRGLADQTSRTESEVAPK